MANHINDCPHYIVRVLADEYTEYFTGRLSDTLSNPQPRWTSKRKLAICYPNARSAIAYRNEFGLDREHTWIQPVAEA